MKNKQHKKTAGATTSSRRFSKEKQSQVVVGKFIGNSKGFGFVTPQSPVGMDSTSTTPCHYESDAQVVKTLGSRAKSGKTASAKNTQSVHAINVCGKQAETTTAGRKLGGNNKQHSVADIFIPPHATLGALDGDIVECKITNEDASLTLDKPSITGKITAVIHRRPIVGAFFTDGQHGFVRPVETKIPYVFSVPPKSILRFGLADGHRVIFSVDKRTPLSRKTELEKVSLQTAFITEVIGHIHDPGMDVLTLVRQASIPYQFSEAVMEEANVVPDTISEEELQGRLDLRNELIFTIDGDDTKDIDDAISFEVTSDNSYKLGVHIADVSHYVKELSNLDRSALDRGTSIYLADRVIPMLPHRLSSGICSLFPNVDRLTLSCLMTVNQQGHVVGCQIVGSVINSKKRWTYSQVQDILDGANLCDNYQCNRQTAVPIVTGETPTNTRYVPATNWSELFVAMDMLRLTLRQKREQKGALDFDLPEAKITVDEVGKPISIDTYARTQATGIIEEFMILCNETIATHFLSLQAPFIYRTHEPPSVDRLAKLANITKSLGFVAPKNANSPIGLQKLLSKTVNTPAAQAVATAVLHSLPQARYTSYDPTHYGLASDAYCHFTSPIRRYADLHIHRIIKTWLNAGKFDRFNEFLPIICNQCSVTERAAEVLEREVEQLKKVQFMSSQEGQTFEGVVSGVTGWGVYVTLPNTIEGTIPVENLTRNKYVYNKEETAYIYKPIRKLKQIERATILRHGVRVKVRLTRVCEEERRIVFALI